MIKKLSTLFILRFIFILLQLVFIKLVTKGLDQHELGFYYFHLTIIFVYQVLFFTPFIINYQRKFFIINVRYNVLQYLRLHYSVIVIYLLFFFISSLIIISKLSSFNIFLFCIYSFLIFRSTIINTYFSFLNKTNLVYIISVSELLLRNLILFLFSNNLDLKLLMIIIISVNVIVFYIFTFFYINTSKCTLTKFVFKIQLFKAIILFKHNFNLIFSACSNYIQNNLYKWVLAFNGNFALLGSISPVMGIGQQIETNLLNITHNTFLSKIVSDRKFRIKYYLFLTILTFTICVFVFIFKDFIILLFLNEKFLSYSSFILLALIYELLNYIIGNYSLIIPLDNRYFNNNILALIFSVILYFLIAFFSSFEKNTILYFFLLPTIFNLILFKFNSSEIK